MQNQPKRANNPFKSESIRYSPFKEIYARTSFNIFKDREKDIERGKMTKQSE